MLSSEQTRKIKLARDAVKSSSHAILRARSLLDDADTGYVISRLELAQDALNILLEDIRLERSEGNKKR